MGEYENIDRQHALSKLSEYWNRVGPESTTLQSAPDWEDADPDDYAEEIYALWENQGKAWLNIAGSKQWIEQHMPTIEEHRNKIGEEDKITTAPQESNLLIASDLAGIKHHANQIIESSNSIEILELVIEDLRTVWNNHPEMVADENHDNPNYHSATSQRANDTAVFWPNRGMATRTHEEDCKFARNAWEKTHAIGEELIEKGVINKDDFTNLEWATWQEEPPEEWDNKVHEYPHGL